ncbi:MAG: NADH-quinone oxidoreductase subunit A [Planctomycetota bacterium]
MTATLPTLAAGDLNHLFALSLLVLMAVGFGVGNVFLTTIVGPSRRGEVKGTTYESGMNPLSDARRRFNVRFYMVAMTYLLFGVEIVFLYPWGATFAALSDESGLKPLFLARVLFFILTSILAFAYAWRKGVFRYD